MDLWHSYKEQGKTETNWHSPEDNMTKLDEVLKRFDSGATRSEMTTAFSLLPWDALQSAAQVMKEGAATHGKHNWKQGFPIDEGLDHVIAHLASYMTGEDDGVDHLAHAICGLLMVKSFDLQGEKFNDE
jgi:hypothetical protein